MKNILFIFLTFLTITSCKESSDECELVTCFNGSPCVEGICECAPGFSGMDCSTPITPSNIRITNVKVNSYPNDSWDNADGASRNADIYFILLKNSVPLYTHSTPIIDALPFGCTDLIPESEINITAVQDIYSIEIWDKDDVGNDDLVSVLSFVPYLPANKFPAILIYENSNVSRISLDASYSW